MVEKGEKERDHAEKLAISADRSRIIFNAATGASVAKGRAPALSGDECRSWADHPV